MDKVSIGIIGQGKVASLIAARCLEAKFSLHILENDCLDEINPLIRLHSSPASLARACSIIMTMLPDSPALEDMLFGQRGIAHSGAHDCIVIEMSSVSPEYIQEVSEQLLEREIPFLDAVLINENSKQVGELEMMFVGGELDVYRRASPTLEKLVKSVKRIGMSGATQFYRQAFAVRKKT